MADKPVCKRWPRKRFGLGRADVLTAFANWREWDFIVQSPGYYGHVIAFPKFPGVKARFQVRIYNRAKDRVVYEKTWKRAES